MLMVLIAVVVLVLLGMLNANAFVSNKHPRLKDVVDKTTPYETYLGLAGVVFGVVEIVNSLTYFHGLLGVVSLVVGLLTFTLGLLSSSSFLRDNCFRDKAALQAKVDECTARLATYQQSMGLWGIVLALSYLLMTLGAY